MSGLTSYSHNWRRKKSSLTFCAGGQDFGGIQFYVNSVLGAGKMPENFYTNLAIRNAFKTWVRLYMHCCSMHRQDHLWLCVGLSSGWSSVQGKFPRCLVPVLPAAAEEDHAAEEHQDWPLVPQRPDNIRLGALQ